MQINSGFLCNERAPIFFSWKCLVLFSIGGILQFLHTSLMAQEVKNAGDVIEAKMTLEKIANSTLGYQASVDIGGLTAGDRINLELTIKNPFDDDIPFSKFGSSCACTDIKVAGGSVFKAKSTTRISLKYLVPTMSSKGKLKLSFGFLDSQGRNKICEVLISGYLKGAIDIGQNRKVFEVTQKQSVYQTEIHFTDPLKAESLDIELCEKLRSVQFAVEANQPGVASIVFTVPFGSLPDKGISGNVKVTHKDTNSSRDFDISFIPRQPIAFSPSWLNFSWDSERKKYVANSIIQIRDLGEPATTSDKQTNLDTKIVSPVSGGCQVEATYNGKSVEVDVQEMAQGSWRLKIFLQKDALPQLANDPDRQKHETILFKIKSVGNTEFPIVDLTVPFFVKE